MTLKDKRGGDLAIKASSYLRRGFLIFSRIQIKKWRNKNDRREEREARI